jgi:hypothetical protein
MAWVGAAIRRCAARKSTSNIRKLHIRQTSLGYYSFSLQFLQMCDVLLLLLCRSCLSSSALSTRVASTRTRTRIHPCPSPRLVTIQTKNLYSRNLSQGDMTSKQVYKYIRSECDAYWNLGGSPEAGFSKYDTSLLVLRVIPQCARRVWLQRVAK